MITFLGLGDYGRFGNQLWQIASTYGIAKANNTVAEFPKWSYNNFFHHKVPDTLRQEYFKEFYNYAEATPYFYMPILNETQSWNLKGYFQSYKYFEHCKDEIWEMFDQDTTTDFSLNKVSIHVRRGDYLSLSHIHPVQGMDYFNKAMELFPKDTVYSIFSDDIAWCKENFIGDQFYFNDYGDAITQFWVMRQCRSNIISNSSFSWWAAWLNKTPDKVVVAPKVWVNGETKDDRVPKDWIRL